MTTSAQESYMSGDSGKQTNLLVLSKITGILDAFTLSRPTMSVSEIREATGLPASTAHRLVTNLVSAGFLDRTDQHYRIGVRMAYWAAPATQGADVVTLAKPELDSLREEIRESVAFFQVSAGYRVCVALSETHEVLRVHMRVGQIVPLHAGSSGRVLLAWTPRLLEEVLQAGLPPITRDTITDPQQLTAAVAKTKEDRFAMTINERETGASGVSAPVFNSQGELLGALNIFGPSVRITPERVNSLVTPVIEGAERMTRIFGGRHPGFG